MNLQKGNTIHSIATNMGRNKKEGRVGFVVRDLESTHLIVSDLLTF